MAELTEGERYKLQAAFWHNVAMSSTFRNMMLELEKGEFPILFKEVLSYSIMSGVGGGVFMDDELDTDGMTDEDIAEHVENRKQCIPWSIVKECCAMWGFDPDPVCNAYWADIEEGLAQNRAFVAGTSSNGIGG